MPAIIARQRILYLFRCKNHKDDPFFLFFVVSIFVWQARGRLLLFEVDYAYLAREDGGHEHAVKLRQVFAKEQLGPVSGEVRDENGPLLAFRLFVFWSRGVGIVLDMTPSLIIFFFIVGTPNYLCH